MADSPTTIHPFPELRQFAEREAMSRIDIAFRVATRFNIYGEDAAKVELTLLCDLTRPASRDAVCRLVAERLGWPTSPTAPSLYWTPGHAGPRDSDGAPEGDDWPAGWWLQAADGNMEFFTGADWCPGDATMIHGMVEGNEHAIEALTAIVRHLWTQE